MMNVSGNVAFVALAGWLMTGIALTTVYPLLPETSPGTESLRVSGAQTADIQREKEALFVATNQQRSRKGLPGLTQNAKLMQAAQQYAELMAAQEQMSHTLNGLTLADKARRVGYSYRQVSENIALNSRLDGHAVVVDQWMESKGHRKNLMSREVADIGIGIAGPSKQHRYYYCQLFGAQL